jgi:hypothetical protein
MAQLGLVFLILICALVACTPKESKPEDAPKSSQVTAESAWTPTSDCLSCHTDIAKSSSQTESLYLPHSGQPCTVCHADADGKLAEVHEEMTSTSQPAKLLNTKVDKSSCLSAGCHTSYKVLGELTSGYDGEYNPHDSHNGQLECTSCHDTHGSQSTLFCGACHPDMKTPESWK